MKIYKRYYNWFIKVLLILPVPIVTYIYIIKGKMYWGGIFLPLSAYFIVVIFTPIIVDENGLKLYRVIRKDWKSLKELNKLNDNLYILKVRGFPWIVQIRETNDFKELIERLEKNISKDFP